MRMDPLCFPQTVEEQNSTVLSTETNMATSTSLMVLDKQPKKTLPPESLNEIVPPLDYSFLKIAAVEECESEEPRVKSTKQFSFKSKTPEEEPEEKSKSLCFRLNNNELKDVNNIMTIASSIFHNPQNIGWIDLSFNTLAKIDSVLTTFENLQILYLHGNAITELKEVNKLASIPKLWKLTLHGNPIEDIKGYKLFCLSAVPNLLNFDFARVTKADRVTANTWKKFNQSKSVKKRHDD